MPSLLNKLVVDEYQKTLQKAQGIVILSASGVTVEEMEKVRGDLDKAGARVRMVRNKLARRTLAELGYEFPAKVFAGNVCIAHGAAESAIHAAKVLTAPEVKKAGKIKLLGGVLDKSQLSAEDVLALANVPDKNTLRAQLLGVLQGPARGLATVLNALPSGLARVLQARVDKSPEASAPAEAS